MLVARAPPPTSSEPQKESAALSAFVRGLAVQAANPKALVFFVALLPQFVDAHASIPEQVAVLAVTSIVIEYAVQAVYVWITARAGAYARRGWTVWLTRVAGGLLIAAGARLAIARSA
jgi:homoserine/homoserine lactone efflux protein